MTCVQFPFVLKFEPRMVQPHHITCLFGPILNYKPYLVPPNYRCHVCGSWITGIRSPLKVMDHHNHIFFTYTSHLRNMALCVGLSDH